MGTLRGQTGPWCLTMMEVDSSLKLVGWVWSRGFSWHVACVILLGDVHCFSLSRGSCSFHLLLHVVFSLYYLGYYAFPSFLYFVWSLIYPQPLSSSSKGVFIGRVYCGASGRLNYVTPLTWCYVPYFWSAAIKVIKTRLWVFMRFGSAVGELTHFLSVYMSAGTGLRKLGYDLGSLDKVVRDLIRVDP